MGTRSHRGTFFTLLLSGFIDYAGIAIVYPIFAYLLFDQNFHFFSPGASDAIRGLWLGVLIALYPFMQFFSSPILGALSDRQGRKKFLLISLLIAFVGYLFAIIGIVNQNLWYLAIYRILVGVAAGNGSIIGAVVADLSTPETKARNFGLLSMSFGAGFTVAPFFGGLLVKKFGYISAFYVPLMLVAINIFFVLWKLRETYQPQEGKSVSIIASFTLLKRATKFKELKGLFLGLLVFTLGWSYFTEFSAIFLVNRFNFQPEHTGFYYGYAGLFYSLSAGFLVFPVARRIGSARALFLAQVLSGLSIMIVSLIYNPLYLWFYMPLVQFFMAFVYPTTSTVISNTVSKDVQGEAMGIYQAVNAIGMSISPFISGALVGLYPWLVVVGGGAVMALGGLVFQLFHTPQESNVPPSAEADMPLKRPAHKS